MSKNDLINGLYDSIGVNRHAACADPDVARIEIHHNKVLGLHLVPGFEVEAKETKDGIDAILTVKKGAIIEKPVQVCFGMLPENGLQQILLKINVEENAAASIMAHCTFPNAVDVRHEMDAVINVAKGARYSYFERHVHSPLGGVTVIPKSKVYVSEDARFKTEFELIRGRVGTIDIDLQSDCAAHSVLDVTARIKGTDDDFIKINEGGNLAGEYARGVLKSHIALKDNARAEIYNQLTASAAYARGHVDCKEIVQGNAVAKAIPVVEVNHPKAHVTHEAAIGSVDSKQLETLMSRGLDEEEAVDLIIEGLLR